MEDVTNRLRLLIDLARCDGHLAPSEETMIRAIGRANGMVDLVVNQLLGQASLVWQPSGLSDQERFAYLEQLIRLMKIDGKIYSQEIRFCAAIAARLGYQEQVLFDLMMQIQGSTQPDAELDMLKKLSATYLRDR